jgi:N-acyl homoserine lactone hydrolase
MKMHVLSGGRLRMKRSVYEPDADRTALIDLPVSCFLIRHPQGNLLFDTGCHPSIATDAEARWGGMAKSMVPVMGPEDNVVSALATIGVAPDDIDVVVNSHLHTDHCGCNAFFKRARFIVHAAELVRARDPEVEGKGYLRVDWDGARRIDAIDDAHDVFGDGKVELVPLPGHTPGAIGAQVTLARDGAFLLAADTVSLRSTLDRELVPRNTWNADLLTRSLQEVRRIERAGAQVICGHDPAQWDALKKGADVYE